VNRDQYDPQPWAMRQGGAAEDRLPTWPSQNDTLVAGLRMTGMVTPMVLDGPINGDWFEAYVTRVLIPELRPGDFVIVDNLSSHKRTSTRDRIEAAGASLRLLPPYSPDFNPIEKAWRWNL
jgi:transposase